MMSLHATMAMRIYVIMLIVCMTVDLSVNNLATWCIICHNKYKKH